MNEEATERMTMNVQVYAMADKYDIPGLKRLAQQRFELFTEIVPASTWSHYGWTLVFAGALRSTPSNDKGFRKSLINACARNIDIVTGLKPSYDGEKARRNWELFLGGDVDFLRDLLVYATRIRSEQLSKALGDLRTVQKTLEDTEKGLGEERQKREYEDDAHEEHRERMGRLLRAATEEPCRRCHQAWRFELIESPLLPGRYLLCCRACHHTIDGMGV